MNNMNQNETKWNFRNAKDGFQNLKRDNVDDELSPEEELNAIQRMRQYKNNYSNIELFENIYESRETKSERGIKTEGLIPEGQSNHPKKETKCRKKTGPYNASILGCHSGTCDVTEDKNETDNQFRLFNDDSNLISSLLHETDNNIDINGMSEGFLDQRTATILQNQSEDIINKLEPEAADYAIRNNIFVKNTRQINTDDAKVVIMNAYYKFKKFINKLLDKFEEKSKKILNMKNWFDKPAEKFVRTSVKRDRPQPPEKNIQNDIDVIKSFIKNVLCFPLAVFMTYNWVYLIMFKNINACEAGSSEECRPARDEVRTKIDFQFMNAKIQLDVIQISKIMDYFFDMAIKPLEYMDKALLGDNLLPKIFAFPMIPRVVYNIIIFLMCYAFLAIEDKKFIFRIVNMVIIIAQFIHTFSAYAYSTLGMSMGNSLIFITGVAGIFFSRAIIAYYSINVSIFLCVIYFCLHSFLGMFMYSIKGVKYLDLFKYIDAFVREDVSYKEKNHYKETIYILQFVYDVLGGISKYLYSVIFFIIYLSMTIKSSVGLKTMGVKYNITLINIFVLLFSLIYIIYKMLKPHDDGIVYKYNVDKREKGIIRSENVAPTGGEGDKPGGSENASPPEVSSLNKEGASVDSQINSEGNATENAVEK
jgi:hypothetical protein